MGDEKMMMQHSSTSLASRSSMGAVRVALVAAMLGFTGMFATPQTADAQDVQVEGPLAGQPAVRHMRLYREGRIRLMPTFGTSLQNEFSRTLNVGLSVSYHFTDWLGIAVWGQYGVGQLDTPLTREVERDGVTNDRNRLSFPSRQNFSNQIGRLRWSAGAQINFIPLRGKLSFFEKLFVDTDFYIFAGVAFVGIEERSNISSTGECFFQNGDATMPTSVTERNACLVASQSSNSNRVQLAPTFGAGISMYFNDYIGLNIEWRGMPFAWNTSGTDENGPGPGLFNDGEINSQDRIPHFNHAITLGMIIYLPTEARITD